MLEDEIVIMNVERYIEVYSNETDELLYSYKITIPDHLVIEIVSPDEDDKLAFFFIYPDSGKSYCFRR